MRYAAAVLAVAVAVAAVPSVLAAEGGKGAAPARDAYKEQFKDEVLVRGARGPVTGVEILSEGYDKVEWKGKTSPVQSRPASEIASLKFADEPATFVRGMEAFRAGRWDEAEAEFRGVASAVDVGRARPMWEARATAWIGECRRRAATAMKEKGAARFKEASGSFRDAWKKDPKSPLAEMIHLGLAEALAGGGEWDDALKALDELKAVATAAGRPVWEAEARLSRGRLLERRGEGGGAALEYEEMARFAEQAAGKAPAGSAERRDLEALRVNGLVSRGWALFGRAEKTKAPADVDAAKKWFDGLPSLTGGSAAGKAAAVNGVGGILLLEGKAQRAYERFVEVEVTMFAVPDEVARALWYKAQACERLGNAAGKEQALKDLAEFYPHSEWAGRAR